MLRRYILLPCYASALLIASIAVAHAGFDVKTVPLSAEKGLATLDYFAWDSAHKHLWVPAGNRASVVVLDSDGAIAATIGDFKTAEFEIGKRSVRLGPSSVTLGDGVAYIGNRADSSVCAVDAAELKRASCLRISTASPGSGVVPDGVQYVPTTKEIWITLRAPGKGIAATDKSIAILDASSPRKLKPMGGIVLGASAEGFAVDDRRGVFYTNLEESAETIAIDLKRRTILERWKSGCDKLRGLALDQKRGMLFVACSNRVVSLDLNHDGKVLGSIDTGEGLDNIDYSETEHLLYAAASTAATLTVASVGDAGEFSPAGVVPTVKGARGVVAGDGKRAYVADPYGGSILIVTQTQP